MSERCCITPKVFAKMSKAQREGYPAEGWTAYALRKEKEIEERKKQRKEASEGGLTAMMKFFGVS